MKKLICVTNKEMANKLAELGYHFMVQHLNGRDIYTFIESENLFDLLGDKKQFNKNHWYIDKRLRF